MSGQAKGPGGQANLGVAGCAAGSAVDGYDTLVADKAVGEHREHVDGVAQFTGLLVIKLFQAFDWAGGRRIVADVPKDGVVPGEAQEVPCRGVAADGM